MLRPRVVADVGIAVAAGDRRLMAAAEDWALRRAQARTLDCHTANAPSIALDQACGYGTIGRLIEKPLGG